MVLRKMYDTAISDKEKALNQLCIRAIFFALRLCEYLITAIKEEIKGTENLR